MKPRDHGLLMKLFQQSTKRPRSFFSGALYMEVDFTHLRDPSEMTIERLSMMLRQTANGKNETFSVCLQLSVQ